MSIKGITVTLYVKTQTGTDAFGVPVYETATTEVYNVLVAPVSSDDIVNDFTLSGRKAVYQLAIPKGDTHDWDDADVEFTLDGQTERFHTFGDVIRGVSDLIPLEWNGKVYVEKYEQS